MTAFVRYLPELDVLVVDCSGRVDLETGLARLKALERELGTRPLAGSRRKLLIDFRNTVWESEATHRQLSAIVRRDFGLGATDTTIRAAVLNNRWSGSVSEDEHWFLVESEALAWLGS